MIGDERLIDVGFPCNIPYSCGSEPVPHKNSKAASIRVARVFSPRWVALLPFSMTGVLLGRKPFVHTGSNNSLIGCTSQGQFSSKSAMQSYASVPKRWKKHYSGVQPPPRALKLATHWSAAFPVAFAFSDSRPATSFCASRTSSMSASPSLKRRFWLSSTSFAM